MKLIESDPCTSQMCTPEGHESSVLYVAVTCNVQDRFEYTNRRFEESDFVMMELYSGVGCDNLVQTTVYPASETCEKFSTMSNTSTIVRLFSNKTASVLEYDNGDCSGKPSLMLRLDKETITHGDCFQNRYRFYTGKSSGRNDSSSSVFSFENDQPLDARSFVESTGVSWPTIIFIVIGSVACVAFVVFAAFKFVRRRHKKALSKDIGIAALATSYAGYPTPESALNAITLGSDATYSQKGTHNVWSRRKTSGTSELWEDEIIVTARVPREKVILQDLISRGGYGEVYSAMFNEERVAVKMLLPEMRKSITHLNAFLAEVKLMATLNHERIVRFIGVAWDSLNDICVLSEYMQGGDLRTMLKTCEDNKTPQGIDRSKATIALHVAHALTYLHSLSPPVLHRDLKSKNILLTSQLHAKLTDFGVSRERSDHTMTGGVGSSRWMAPEVMMGERYDDKADMFSFGVVLAELDQHLIPYANVKENSDSGRVMPDLAILQMVATGKLRIQFSSAAPQDIKELGLKCVSIDPKDRPTASEALYTLHTLLRTVF
ncbi:tkl protein kinase [Plasmopara halstedii]|uniref:Tkl protein kinase n=1 Tax=Plasmopara halstedii TaxID=4781 RepID=A0A0N7L657_PLAHL|nr:tkl protein kinase [Plasmopara halstedii]CEG43347.1 tkl protein kinase [Plasmopara halstedii]|eukprot:XP_024579716.1 tkl protein kinase [Plasmopara halstedii]